MQSAWQRPWDPLFLPLSRRPRPDGPFCPVPRLSQPCGCCRSLQLPPWGADPLPHGPVSLTPVSFTAPPPPPTHPLPLRLSQNCKTGFGSPMVSRSRTLSGSLWPHSAAYTDPSRPLHLPPSPWGLPRTTVRCWVPSPGLPRPLSAPTAPCCPREMGQEPSKPFQISSWPPGQKGPKK